MANITLKDVNGNNIYPAVDVSTLSGTITENATGFVIGDDVYTALGDVGHYHRASATVTNTGNNFTITLSSNNSYVVLDNSAVSGTQALNFTIVPPPLEQDELLDCMVQFRPHGSTTSGHTVSAKDLIQVGLRKYINGSNLNFILNNETAQIRLLGNTYCLM